MSILLLVIDVGNALMIITGCILLSSAIPIGNGISVYWNAIAQRHIQ